MHFIQPKFLVSLIISSSIFLPIYGQYNGYIPSSSSFSSGLEIFVEDDFFIATVNKGNFVGQSFPHLIKFKTLGPMAKDGSYQNRSALFDIAIPTCTQFIDTGNYYCRWSKFSGCKSINGGIIVVNEYRKERKGPPWGSKIGEQLELMFYDYSGNQSWKSTVSNTIDSAGVSDAFVMSTSVNIFIVCSTKDSNENSKYLLIKSDLNGQQIESKYLDVDSTFQLVSVSISSDNHFILGGQILNAQTKTPYCVKVDSNGTLVWDLQLNNNHSSIKYLQELNDGNYLLTVDKKVGVRPSNDNIIRPNLIKVSNTGNVIWNNVLETNNGDGYILLNACKTIEGNNGELYLMANFTAGPDAVQFYKLDKFGEVIGYHWYNKVWWPYKGEEKSPPFFNKGYVRLNDFIIADNETFTFVGSGEYEFDGGTVLIQTDKEGCFEPSCSSLENGIFTETSTEKQTEGIHISPNPYRLGHQKYIHIKGVNSLENVHYSIISSLGEIVLEGELVDNIIELNSMELNPGIFYLRIQTNIKTIQKSIVIN